MSPALPIKPLKPFLRRFAQNDKKTFIDAFSFTTAVLFLFFLLRTQFTAASIQMDGMQANFHQLPPISIRHLQTLTDATGIYEFAHGTVPWHENGYCAEDVARALAAVTLYEQVSDKSDGRPLASQANLTMSGK